MTIEKNKPADLRPSERSDFHEYLRSLIAAWKMIVCIAAGVLALGMLYMLLGAPVFRANTLIQVEDKKADLMGLDDLLGTSDDSLAQTEIELMYSRMVLGSVVKELSLDVDATPKQFPIIGGAIARHYEGADPAPAPLGLARYAWGGEQIVAQKLEVPKELLDEKLRLVAGENGRFTLYDPDGDKVLEGETGKLAASKDGRFSILISTLRARPLTRFRLIKRPYEDVLEELQNDLVINERGKKTGIIRIQLSGTDIEKVVRTLKAHAAAYVRQNVARKSQEAESTLGFVETQLPEVKERLERAEVALDKYRAEHRTMDLSMETQAALDRAAQIEKGATELQLEKAGLSERFGENHPALNALRKKMAQIEASRKALNQQISKLPESDLYSVRLIRDVTVANELYVFLLNKAQELKIEKSGTIGNVRVVDHAIVPYKPAYPRPAPMLAISLVAGLLLGRARRRCDARLAVAWMIRM